MSKAPKKIPAWIATFADYAKKAESDESTHRAVDTFTALTTKHWEQFHSALEAKKDDGPKKKKRIVDPMKTLESAMERVAGHVEEAKNNEEHKYWSIDAETSHSKSSRLRKYQSIYCIAT